MQITEVIDAAAAKDFIQVNVLMNKNNAAYIRPLDNEVNDVFDAAKNRNFKYGDIKRWLLKDTNGNLIGRIAAFTHKKYINKGTDFATGGIGYFDCINDTTAAALLFDTAKAWLLLQGMEAMDGPINFLDRDKWWGLLVEGFDKEPIYGMSFNPEYYQQLFDAYGFQHYYNQFYYAMIVADPMPDRFPERYYRFKNKPEFTAKHISIRNLEKHAEEFVAVYNAAWAQHGGAKELNKKQVMQLFNKLKPIMDERLVWFAYYKETPIAMWINIPDLNQYFKHFNGKFGVLQKLHLLWLKYTKACKKFTGVAFGVIPKFQSFGIDSFMIYEASFVIQGALQYETLEIGWAGDWNPKMISIYKSLGGHQSRRLITYRYLFDRNKPFERHPEV